ncbi:hypothetical protein [Micromonospora sp. C95]|uniref:hypothetical protein n=1 Tax=Micromonospora sp. C95 TaxID=2824882 RepID=UPI001B35C225|nr:hypothetical protein [Micromonospora sp. C95]MBQ1023339.1 hypothetical protein [Micromonospora sp. C95]
MPDVRAFDEAGDQFVEGRGGPIEVGVLPIRAGRGNLGAVRAGRGNLGVVRAGRVARQGTDEEPDADGGGCHDGETGNGGT